MSCDIMSYITHLIISMCGCMHFGCGLHECWHFIFLLWSLHFKLFHAFLIYFYHWLYQSFSFLIWDCCSPFGIIDLFVVSFICTHVTRLFLKANGQKGLWQLLQLVQQMLDPLKFGDFLFTCLVFCNSCICILIACQLNLIVVNNCYKVIRGHFY